MKAFDPWTATHDDAMEAYLYDGKALSKWTAALYVTHKKIHFEQHPIDGVAHCLKACLPVPQWLSVAFLSMYEKFENLTVDTLDEAFNRTPKNGRHLLTRRLKKQHTINIEIAFTVAGGQKRNLAGRREVAKKLGLTEKQVRTFSVNKRLNVKGHKPYAKKSDIKQNNANDPFGLAKKVPKI